MAAPRTRKPAAPKAAGDSPVIDISIKALPVSTIRVSLVGELYSIKPPKASLGLALAAAGRAMTEAGSPEDQLAASAGVQDALDDWITAAFGSLAPKIQARLAAPGDALDIPHINQLMTALTAQATGTPTT